MNGSTLIALIWLPCVSALHQSALGGETVAFVCPDTVKYVYDTVQVDPVPKAKPVVAKKKAAPKKKYRKRRRHK